LSQDLRDDVALVCLDATGESGAVLVHAPHMVSMLADYFDLLWAKAVTLGGEDDGTGPLPAVQRRILRLASQGFKDESIVRASWALSRVYLGVHFRFDGEYGVASGRAMAESAATRFVRARPARP
jgi:hypothetical protein